MAEQSKPIEREYVIPLRRHYLKVPHYRRTGKAIQAIKMFVAKHMKIADRDVNNVKLDVYLNNDLWAKGRTNPPTRVKVKVVKEGDIVHVSFVEIPQHVQFAKARHERMHKAAEKSSPAVAEKKEEKTEEQKKDEQEKEKSSALAKAADMKQEVKAEKHTTKSKEATRPQRMALQK